MEEIDPGVFSLPLQVTRDVPLITSLCYYAFTILISRLLRSVVSRACVPRSRQHWLRVIGAFQTLSCSFENKHVRRHYGDLSYATALVLVSTWHCVTCLDGTSGNPCNLVERFANGSYTARSMIGHLVLQTIGALIGRQYARLFWNLRLSRDHAARADHVTCDTDLTVSLVSGFAIEFGATLAMRLLAISDVTAFVRGERMAKRILDAWVTVLGIHLTGMYMNPLNASNQTLGCRGTSFASHVFVYWVAPLSAAYIAVCAHRYAAARFAKTKWRTEKASAYANGFSNSFSLAKQKIVNNGSLNGKIKYN